MIHIGVLFGSAQSHLHFPGVIFYPDNVFMCIRTL